jgi:hypothetical protein
MGATDDTTPGNRLDPFPLKRISHFFQPGHHSSGALQPGIAHLLKGSLQTTVDVVYKIPQDVCFAPGNIGTDFNTWYQPELRECPRGCQCRGNTVYGIMVGQGNYSQALAHGFTDELGWAEAPIGCRRMQVKVRTEH